MQGSNNTPPVANRALVTKSLVVNGSRPIRHPSLDLPSFFDFSSLCEAVVILDGLEVLESPEGLPEGPIAAALRDAGSLREFTPRLSWLDMQRVMLRLPEDVHRLISSVLGGEPWFGSDQPRLDDELTPGGAIAAIDYDQGADFLLAQLQDAVNYESLEPGKDPRGRALRSILYLIAATANGLDYFADFDRAPFVAAAVDRLYRSLPLELYERVAGTVSAAPLTGQQLVSEWSLDVELPIPPVTALVLHAAEEREEIPYRLMQVREQFAGYRTHFREFKEQLQSAETLEERRRLEQKYRRLLEDASGPNPEIVSATEVLNLAEKTVRAAAAPALPTSYSAALLLQPAEWVRRWWRRRPLAVLYRMDGKLPRLPEYRQLITRLWGEEVGDGLLEQYVRHARQIDRLLHRGPTSGGPSEESV